MSDSDKTEFISSGKSAAAANPLAGIGAPPAKLICLDTGLLVDPGKGADIMLTDHEQVVGRTAEGCTVVLEATGISKRHARIYPKDGLWRISDLGSTNGVHVNGVKTEDMSLKGGDTVKIGKVPFQFVVERPDITGAGAAKAPEKDFDPDKTVSERTMFVGSNLMAAAMLIDAKSKQDAQQKAAQKPASGSARAAAAAAAQQPRQSSAGKWLTIAAVLLLLAGGGYWFKFMRGVTGSGGVNVAALQSELKAFRGDYEDSAAGYDASQHQQQMTVLTNMQAQLSDAAGKQPDNLDVKVANAQVLFLRVERGLMHATQQSNFADAAALLTQAQSGFNQLKPAADSKISPEQTKALDEVGGLLTLAAAVLEIKAFTQQYANPSAEAQPQPSKADLDKVAQVRQQFADLRRKNNLALSVGYPFFNALVNGVDQKDILILDKWGQIIK